MLATPLALMTCVAPQGPVVVNEFSYDDSGTDNRGFVELYNRSGGPVDISGWLLDSEDPFGPKHRLHDRPGHGATTGRLLGARFGGRAEREPGRRRDDLWENSNESLTLRDLDGAATWAWSGRTRR
jgi:hypothetical protein